MKLQEEDIRFRFLTGTGEMRQRIMENNWENTPVGRVESWPQALKITLNIMINSRFPMFLWWGKDLTCFYNDAYRPSLGKEGGKHPGILGMDGKDAWPEIWDIIGPLIERVQKGESVWFEDLLVPIHRNGTIEDVYWTFSYSPVYADGDEVSGVLVTCTETTEKVMITNRLAESDRNLRLVIHQAPVAITIMRTREHRLEIINRSMLDIWGRTENEVLGKPLGESSPELVQQGLIKLLDSVFDTGEKVSFNEYPVHIRKNGKMETIYVNFTYEALYNEYGDIDGVMAVAHDVTQQVEAYKKVEESEEQLNIVIEASALGTYELDMKTGAPSYSDRYLEIIGYPHGTKLKHGDILKLLHPDDLHIRTKAFQEAMKTGILQYQSRIIWNDGTLHWFEGRGKLFFDEDGKPDKLIGTLRDITNEKMHQQKLEESETRFRNLVMQSPVPKAILKGKDHIVEMANNALLENIWRKKPEEVVGKPVLEVFPELRSLHLLKMFFALF